MCAVASIGSFRSYKALGESLDCTHSSCNPMYSSESDGIKYTNQLHTIPSCSNSEGRLLISSMIRFNLFETKEWPRLGRQFVERGPVLTLGDGLQKELRKGVVFLVGLQIIFLPIPILNNVSHVLK